jgi:hypothetical protein
MSATRSLAPFALLTAFCLAGACSSNSSDTVEKEDGGVRVVDVCPEGGGGGGVTTQSLTVDKTGQSTVSQEWVAFHIEIPYAGSDFHSLISGLIGANAQAGKFIQNQEVSPGVYLGAVADPSTPEQSRISLAFDDGTPVHRTLALVPASFTVGAIFATTIDAAVTTMQSEEAASPGSSESYLLQYQVTSPMGGTFSLGVHGVLGVFSLVLDVATPPTNLAVAKIGTPATSTTPYDLINGTVYFHSSQDDFDYFVQHAYGADATAGQNFQDFSLVPHTWLRLTVTPHLSQKFVNVAFQVLANDGTRTPVAQAPASILAGKAFQTLVDHNMSTMSAQESKKAGSSYPWSAPFYYDDPQGGGVVEVDATGAAGVFVLDYTVQSPRHVLTEVPFNAYEPVTIVPPEAGVTAACNKLGNPGIVSAAEGAFDITFGVSDVIMSSDAGGPLVGPIFCSTYKQSDVTVAGPNPGAVALQNFSVASASFQPGAPAPHYLTGNLPDGEYQILCGQDLKHNGNIGFGDPVTLPVGGFTIACNVNPITVQFALLDPQGG